jgi:hypothetical protein
LGGADVFELLRYVLGFGLVNGLLDQVRSALHQVHGLRQAQARKRTYHLDGLDRLGAGFFEDDVELGLLLGDSLVRRRRMLHLDVHHFGTALLAHAGCRGAADRPAPRAIARTGHLKARATIGTSECEFGDLLPALRTRYDFARPGRARVLA